MAKRKQRIGGLMLLAIIARSGDRGPKINASTILLFALLPTPVALAQQRGSQFAQLESPDATQNRIAIIEVISKTPKGKNWLDYQNAALAVYTFRSGENSVRARYLAMLTDANGSGFVYLERTDGKTLRVAADRLDAESLKLVGRIQTAQMMAKLWTFICNDLERTVDSGEMTLDEVLKLIPAMEPRPVIKFGTALGELSEIQLLTPSEKPLQ